MDAVRMHAASTESRAIVDSVLDYSRRRMLSDDVPLDKPQSPAELRRLAGRTITDEGLGAQRALSVFEHILAPACLTTSHPLYLSFIPTAPTIAAMAFDLVVSASGLYGGSWLEGAGAVHAENEVLSFLAGEFGLPETAGGVFVQGGTIGNLSALVAARETAREKLAAAGRPAPARWKIVCSIEAHSSNKSAAKVMDAEVVVVPAGADGVLREDAVRAALEEHGDAVCAVVATAGSTNFGIVDDIAGIAALKDEFDFWLHIDGAYGLTAALAPEAKPIFAGVERADSLIVDPHKWLFAPFDCCALIYRDPDGGRRAHAACRVPRHPHRHRGLQPVGLLDPAHAASAGTAAVVLAGHLRRRGLPAGGVGDHRADAPHRRGDRPPGRIHAGARSAALGRGVRAQWVDARRLRPLVRRPARCAARLRRAELARRAPEHPLRDPQSADHLRRAGCHPRHHGVMPQRTRAGRPVSVVAPRLEGP